MRYIPTKYVQQVCTPQRLECGFGRGPGGGIAERSDVLIVVPFAVLKFSLLKEEKGTREKAKWSNV